MQAGMEIPQELLKGSVKKPKTDGVQAVGLKSAIKKKEFCVRYNPITCQLRVFRNAKPVKEVDLDLWAKFIAEGRQRMKASAYREWCERNGRDSSQPVKFNTKNGPILRVAEYYQQAKIVEWAKLGPANDKNINSHSKVW
jgi:hypothetical protein